jgi:hypothetical protein
VVRWGLIAGGLCIVAAALVALGSISAANNRDLRAEADAERNAKLCQEQIANGTRLDDGTDPCAYAVAQNEVIKGWVAAGVLLLLGVAQFVGSARIGITLTGAGVIVRNPLRTHRVRWAEIDQFAVDVGYAGRLSYAFGRVDLRDGESHRIEAICAMPWEPKEAFHDERVIHALNEELAARLAEMESGPDGA